MLYTIKNWRQFQHYKDRNPPWIKLHFSILSSADWVTLDDSSRVLAVACMLLASRNEGQIDGSDDGLEYIRRVAYLKRTPDLSALIKCGFLESASSCKQMLANARPETETETEAETYKEEEDIAPKSAGKRKKVATPIPEDFGVSEAVASWAEERGFGQLDLHLSNFIDSCKAKAYQYADWDAAFRKAISSNWAKITGNGQSAPSDLGQCEWNKSGNRNPLEGRCMHTATGKSQKGHAFCELHLSRA